MSEIFLVRIFCAEGAGARGQLQLAGGGGDEDHEDEEEVGGEVGDELDAGLLREEAGGAGARREDVGGAEERDEREEGEREQRHHELVGLGELPQHARVPDLDQLLLAVRVRHELGVERREREDERGF